MKYIVKARVRLDLKKHWRYIARDNVDAADRLLEAAEQTFELIAAHPDSARSAAFENSSEFVPESLTALATTLSFTSGVATES